ncbi:MAG TPA: CHRD domain-containing protein [Tepidisphaeraceae bacterium]|jgi:hypothetical protein|nr:CHRD domain-containing protein [Tepidisphaeraceae bacterium]
MKKVCLLTGVVLLACSIARAEVHIYDFPLDGPQADALRNPQSPGTGIGHVTYNDLTNELSWIVTYQNLLGPVTNSHFHGPALPGVDAGVVVPQTNGFDSPQTGGPVVLTATQETQLLSGLWYYNIHTTFDTGGEIRGQVVPEPATMGLLACGAIGLLIRRRRFA